MRIRSTAALAVVAFALCPATGSMAAGVPMLDPERGVMTMAPLLETATPAVVNISVKTQVPQEENPLLRDPFFRRFFDVPDEVPDREAMAAGSGVIVDAAKGYVLTNHHVVENAKEITVTLKDQRRFKAKLIGSDPGTDVALLTIEPDKLTALPIGDSDRLKVGDLVVAIGNPFGLGQTVTSGIVSALGRSGIAAEKYEDFIQTDASINPGNSGGALVNSKGELIGINTAIIAPGGGNVGIGFAVPSNMARQVMDQLIRFGEVRRGRLGILIQDLTPDLAAALDLAGKHGAVVSSVQKGSPAEKAGLKSGDVIVEVDGNAIHNSTDLRNRIGLKVRGTAVTLGFFRGGRMMTARVTIGAVQEATLEGDETVPLLAGALITELGNEHPAKGKVEGVLVARVAQGSRAWVNGLREGDIILAVNRERVRSLAEFKKAASRHKTLLALNVLRGDSQLFIVMR